VTVTIAKKDIAGATVTLGKTLTYNGSEQTKTVTSVKIDGLTVTYTVAGNTAAEVGTYTLTVTGTGNFTGTVEKTWSIVKASSGGSASVPAYPVDVTDSTNGKIESDMDRASKDDTVTLTIKPEQGYVLEKLVITDQEGNEIPYVEEDGKYTFTMPASKVSVAVTFLEDIANQKNFADVPADAYYAEAVRWAANNGIAAGVEGDYFLPDAYCTRAQAITLLWRAAGSPAPESSMMRFEDVAEDAYYYEAVLWAVEKGLTTGISETEFAPDMECTRAQIATLLWRAAGYPTAEGIEMRFADVAEGAYYYEAVLWAVEAGVTTGTTETTFTPDVQCTRAQIVTFLWRSAK
ncbi:MAG: S-layer homology domain-containing protein, partial [Clostridia bacterium]|nr:S-layer homology domain-containing protein [Clostridia bacterium]